MSMRVVIWIACAAFAPLATLHAAEATEPAAAPHLNDALGLQPSLQAVRERPGWRTPHIILLDPALHDVLPQLQQVAPGVKLLELSAATPREVAAADATIGVCSAEVLGRARRLEWIQWLGAGVETCVRQPLLKERHPLLTNMQRTAAPSMAEHVIAMMLVLSRHLDYFMHEQNQAHWAGEDSSPQPQDLEGKTVLIVGLGGIGTEVAKRAHALGMRITATRASGHSGPDYVSYVGLPDELLKLTKDADFIVNCAPLTPQTSGIFDRQFFSTMKPSAYFLNVGRGASAVTADLVAALEGHKIAGAGLDVVDPEPLPADNPLWKAPNVLITPHISGNSSVTDEQRLALLRENLRRFVAGDSMLAVVDISRGY